MGLNLALLLALLLLLVPSQALVAVTDAATGTTHDFPSDLSPFLLSVLASRRFERRRFRLDHDGALGAAATLTLHAADAPAAPAASVDPFWASEATNLPQTAGLAARWYWPKALTGNTHPGASLPHGFVSATAFSGAYPTGYGINSPSSSAKPASATDAPYGAGPTAADLAQACQEPGGPGAALGAPCAPNGSRKRHWLILGPPWVT